ncbi:MarR family transcriptional regulator [Altererythrobacter soli]|uniref:MarR family transcriptional regulator n=1 Tax=Croceibacterium soli TaxID=1739690 RepID=A0A6I4UQZ0_9SPHN|nr:MarR family transcriptional regulator [Croceibacterium soli]MXP41302.1 MarR family transcriptional regulator [Croceibacterium soli]
MMELPATWHLFGEEHLPQRLLLLAKMIERVASKQLQVEFGISVAQWRILAFVCTDGPATASHIGSSGEIDQAEISRAVKALEGDGYVSREFAEGSRKTMIISPTAKGEQLFRKVRDLRRNYFSAITRDLDRERKAEFDRTLEVIAKAVIELRETGAPA